MKSLLSQLQSSVGQWTSHAFLLRLDDKGFSRFLAEVEEKYQDDYEIQIFGTEQELFSVEQVRKLRQVIILKTIKERLLIIRAKKLPIVSQNAMLKLVEEGSSQTTLIITTTGSASILPTLRSRVQLVSGQLLNNDPVVIKFMSSDLVSRFSQWDSIKESGLIGDLFVKSIDYLQSVNNSDELRLVMKVYQGWQSGVIAPKYAYESLSITFPTVKLGS